MKAKPVVPRTLAQRDIEQAVDYLRDNASEKAALGLIDDIERALTHFGRHPGTGSTRTRARSAWPAAWSLSRHPYLVFYVERESYLDVWRVLHGKRDIPAWLNETATADPNS